MGKQTTPVIITLLLAFTVEAAAPWYGVKVVHVYPHDRAAFTQGLEYHDGVLYEGTGLNGHSSLRTVRLSDGKVLRHVDLPSEYFGEGITVIGGRVLQLTWISHIGFIYDRASFRKLGSFEYRGEGWGLTSGAGEIYQSDGTPEIRCLDLHTLKERRRITVRDGAEPVPYLNELEWVRGEIYANVWQTDRIARISPKDGRVLGWIDAAGLMTASEVDVLNGIAYDAQHDRLFITGKLWPKLFEIRLVPRR